MNKVPNKIASCFNCGNKQAKSMGEDRKRYVCIKTGKPVLHEGFCVDYVDDLETEKPKANKVPKCRECGYNYIAITIYNKRFCKHTDAKAKDISNYKTSPRWCPLRKKDDK